MNDNFRLASEWKLSDATLTAVALRGQVFNERGLSLAISEGRFEQIHLIGDSDETREVWDYQLTFCIVDCAESDNSSQSEALISIVGRLDDGRQCKIHGNGYVGRDNLGQIEGTFLQPPKIEIAGFDDDLAEWDRPE